MAKQRYDIQLGGTVGKCTRVFIYRDGKKVMQMNTGGKIIPKRLQAWVDQLNQKPVDLMVDYRAAKHRQRQ
jgi:hypothetical protein